MASKKNSSSQQDLANTLLWEMLPPELEGYFNISGHEKTDTVFRIWLTEKNIIPEVLPEEYRGKKIVNTYTRDFIMDDFPIR